jgi:hypothetical protein
MCIYLPSFFTFLITKSTYSFNSFYPILLVVVVLFLDDEFYIITELLAKGTYTTHFKSSVLCQETDYSDPNFAQDVKYVIIAE